jgi:hypothetical protein
MLTQLLASNSFWTAWAEGTKAFYYPPPTPEETATSMTAGMSGLPC